jgi:hypothetical protein
MRAGNPTLPEPELRLLDGFCDPAEMAELKISPYGRNDTNARIGTYSLIGYSLINLNRYTARLR